MDNNQKRSPLYKSFGYAFEGIFNTIKDERNIKIHLVVTVLVIIFGFILNISLSEWFVCILLFAIIIPLELVNTAIEAVVDMTSKGYDPLAKKAKDAAAGAVLVAAILSAVIGGIIFFPKLYYFIIELFS
ncbi:MAG: diacylglycerol kinase family protein [Butyrivibrio sp.]|uniref:diacylglycerol kinase family protein n=1 Tax=Butyrivibrio sp. TaxID=28121 RepID=UPI0025E3ADA8|nr:diacylglycerol kinase family protein [Butyrivibrio sp.]MCR5770222.1 diacylglycerol kinase family protein [Butyrivibrio sp.]